MRDLTEAAFSGALDFELIVRGTPGMSGADLANLVEPG
jgi:ATP-dependent Zn protease